MVKISFSALRYQPKWRWLGRPFK